MYAGTSVTSPRGMFTAEILYDGIPQPVYVTGDGYPYVAGTPGQVCQVRVMVLTGGRIGIAMSVDGRDILEDQVADLSRPSLQIITGGYTFKGFRVDDEKTREFILGTVTGSVAHQAGSTASTGVIGLAGWRERLPVAGYAKSILRRDNEDWTQVAVAGATDDMTPRSLGMHAGETRHDPVGRTTFDRDGTPDVLEIGYNTMAALEAMGITQRRPTAFPGRTTGYEAYRL